MAINMSTTASKYMRAMTKLQLLLGRNDRHLTYHSLDSHVLIDVSAIEDLHTGVL